MRAAKVDANHAAIVDALRKIGCFVQSLAQVGKGCPDLLVGHAGRWHAIEVKDGAKVPSARKLTPDEAAWHEKAKKCAPVHVVESAEQAIKIVRGE